MFSKFFKKQERAQQSSLHIIAKDAVNYYLKAKQQTSKELMRLSLATSRAYLDAISVSPELSVSDDITSFMRMIQDEQRLAHESKPVPAAFMLKSAQGILAQLNAI